MFIEKKIFLTFERSIELNRFMPLDAYFKVEYGNPASPARTAPNIEILAFAFSIQILLSYSSAK